jgi:tetratricopeptide (TPR) repeat protein
MRHHSYLVLLVLFLMLFPPIYAEAGDSGWEETFFAANQAYREGRYEDAIRGYSRLSRDGLRSGVLYYNLGNAYFRLKKLGQAVLHYERAKFYIPRDADLSFNLRHTRDLIRDPVLDAGGFVNTAFFWLDAFNLIELFWCFSFLNFLFWGILFLKLFRKAEWTFYVSLFLFIFWLISGGSFGFKWYQMVTDNRAVILPQEAKIMAGPDENDTVLFKVHQGTIVYQERSEAGWSLIHLPDRKRGWMNSKAMARIVNNGILLIGSPMS